MNTLTKKLLPATALVGMFLSGAVSAQGYQSTWEQHADDLRQSEVIQPRAELQEATAYYLENTKLKYQEAMDMEKGIAMGSNPNSTTWYYGG